MERARMGATGWLSVAACLLSASRFPAFQKLLDERKGIFDRTNQDEVDAWRLAVGEAIDKLTRMR